MKKKGRVALIFGGEGAEHDISVMGADFVSGELYDAGYSVLPVLIRRDGAWLLCSDGSSSCRDMDNGEADLVQTFPVRLGGMCGFLSGRDIIDVDAAIPLLHGELGEDGVVQGALRCAGIPFIGCDTVCGAVGIDKAFTKIIVGERGVPVARGIYSSGYESAEELCRRAEELIGYPMFVKPTRLGSSIGAAVANNKDELLRAAESALALGSGRIMIEELISSAGELECAAICTKGKLLFTDIGEIACKDGFYDYENKYGADTCASVKESAELPDDIKSKILEYSRTVAEVLGIRGLSRIDFLLGDGGNIYFNEINTMPGMTGASMFPRLIEGYGMPLGVLFGILIEETAKSGDEAGASRS